MSESVGPDLIHGFAAIGQHLGISRNTARERAAKGELPTFRMGDGKAVYARKSELNNYAARRVMPRRGRPPCNNPEERRAANAERRAERLQELQEVARLRKERALADLGAAGLLYGMQAIADFLGLTVRQAGHLHKQGRLPVFKMGRAVCARKGGLKRFLSELEQGAR